MFEPKFPFVGFFADFVWISRQHFWPLPQLACQQCSSPICLSQNFHLLDVLLILFGFLDKSVLHLPQLACQRCLRKCLSQNFHLLYQHCPTISGKGEAVKKPNTQLESVEILRDHKNRSFDRSPTLVSAPTTVPSLETSASDRRSFCHYTSGPLPLNLTLVNRTTFVPYCSIPQPVLMPLSSCFYTDPFVF